MSDADGTWVSIGDDFKDNIAQADEFASKYKEDVDAFIEKTGMDAWQDDQAELRAAYDSEPFVGLHFLDTREYESLPGVGDDAEHVAKHFAARRVHASA